MMPDLFIVDARGEVASTWWEPGCGWQPWFTINPEMSVPYRAQKVSAVWSNNKTHLDLFIVTSDGTVKTTFWEANPAPPLKKGWQDWFPIGASGNAAAGQSVTALWSNPRHLDLFITAADGTVKSTFWEANPAPPLQKGWQDWLPKGP
jgi:hypothetical protein